jgi:hypothetical protein
MTQDDIIRMAREAGIYHAFDSEGHWDGLTDAQLIERHPPHPDDIVYADKRIVEILKAFAALVRADERDTCAKVVDHILKEGGGTWGDAIRARGNT